MWILSPPPEVLYLTHFYTCLICFRKWRLVFYQTWQCAEDLLNADSIRLGGHLLKITICLRHLHYITENLLTFNFIIFQKYSLG